MKKILKVLGLVFICILLYGLSKFAYNIFSINNMQYRLIQGLPKMLATQISENEEASSFLGEIINCDDIIEPYYLIVGSNNFETSDGYIATRLYPPKEGIFYENGKANIFVKCNFQNGSVDVLGTVLINGNEYKLDLAITSAGYDDDTP